MRTGALVFISAILLAVVVVIMLSATASWRPLCVQDEVACEVAKNCFEMRYLPPVLAGCYADSVVLEESACTAQEYFWCE